MTVFGVAKWCGAWMLACSAAAFAQGVYVTQGEKGPVFSDKPQSGAKEVRLRPLSVVPVEKNASTVETSQAGGKNGTVAPPGVGAAKGASGSGGESRRDDAAPAYANFLIVSPEDGGSVVANTGAFEVRLAVEPRLLLGEGHAFVVRINGRELAQRFTSTELLIPSEFWGDSLPAPNQEAQIDAAIVDGTGRVLKRAAPVRFFMRYATVLNRPHPLVPIHPIQPIHPVRPIPPQPIQPVQPVKPTPPPKAVGATSGKSVGATSGKLMGETIGKD